MLHTLVNHTPQNTSHTQPQLTSQLQYTTNQPHTTLKTDVVILSLNPAYKPAPVYHKPAPYHA